MKKKIVLIAVNALLLLAFIACLIASGTIKNTLTSQQAAKAFAGESDQRFAQISAFLPTDSGFDLSSIQGLYSGFDAALVEAGLEKPETGSLYTDAWSGHGKIQISGARGEAEAVAIGVGGDFFLFHPLYLRDGSYLQADDLMKDRILLDEEMAWRLFGSVDLAGLTVTIGEKPYLIAGVVSREDDFASQKAYADGAGVYMSYEALLEQTEAPVTCYEVAMADPISGFALKTMEDAFSSRGAALVENSDRYSMERLFSIMGQFGKRSMRTDEIMYPYWENAARYTEDWTALLLLLELLLILCPLVCAVILLVKLIRSLSRRGKRLAAEKIEDRDRRAAEEYERTHMEEYILPDVEDIVREVLEEQAQEEAQKTEENDFL